MNQVTEAVCGWINRLPDDERWVYVSTAREDAHTRLSDADGEDDGALSGLVYESVFRRPENLLPPLERELRQILGSECEMDHIEWEALGRELLGLTLVD